MSTAGLRFDIAYHQCTDCRIGSFAVILPGESEEEPPAPNATRCSTSAAGRTSPATSTPTG